MIPSQFDYFAILGVLTLFLIAAYQAEIVRVAKSFSFWVSSAVFVVACTGLELVGLALGWWRFNPQRTCGVRVLQIPIEEFALFALIYTLAVVEWERPE